MIDDIKYGTGIGSSKKESEQEAAKDALTRMANNDK
jgi:dsRNA-specific ribonuclease